MEIEDFQKSLNKHLERFCTFVDSALEISDAPPLLLKHEHILRVLEHTRCLLGILQPEPVLHTVALLAALYHDIGRFPQYLRWQTFADVLSTNHALLSVRVLKSHGLLNDESARVRGLTLAAVALHNRFALPTGLTPDLAFVAHLVRDADKLDIACIMAEHLSAREPSGTVVLHVRNAPQEWTPAVAQAVLENAEIRYSDLRVVNDFRLLLASWIHAMHFLPARRLYAASGHIETVLQGLPDAAELLPVRAHIAATILDATRLVANNGTQKEAPYA